MKSRITFDGITLLHYAQYTTVDFWTEAHHSHDHCEIFLHEQGTLTVLVEDTVYRHNGKEIRIYAPGELHFGRAERDQYMEWYQISLPRSFFERHAPLGRILDRPHGVGNVFVCQRHDELVALAREIFQKKEECSPLTEAYFHANIERILCLLGEGEQQAGAPSEEHDVLQDVLSQINEHFRSLHTLEDLSSLVHYAPSYLHRLFRERLQTTPHRYIQTKRLTHAKNRLAAGASVADACEDAGFESYPNFITLFRKTYGITPKKFQAQCLPRS